MTKKYSYSHDFTDRSNSFYWQTNRDITINELEKIFVERDSNVSKEEIISALEYTSKKIGYNQKIKSISEPKSNGNINTVVVGTFEDDSKMVIRIHPKLVKNGYFWAESQIVEFAKQHNVKTFDVLYIYDKLEEFQFDFMVMSAAPGRAVIEMHPLTPELDERLMIQTGEQCALIHNCVTKGFGFFDNKLAKSGELKGQFSSFQEHFYAGLDQDLELLIKTKTITQDDSDNFKKIFEDNSDMLAIEQGVLIHNDIADWNEMSNGQDITAMIDWDESFSGDPVMDFAQWSLFFDDARLEHFKKGYSNIKPLPDNFEHKLHLFRLRYTISKMHLRVKRYQIKSDAQEFLKDMIKRGFEVLQQEVEYFNNN